MRVRLTTPRRVNQSGLWEPGLCSTIDRAGGLGGRCDHPADATVKWCGHYERVPDKARETRIPGSGRIGSCWSIDRSYVVVPPSTFQRRPAAYTGSSPPYRGILT
jgi:hypothetical protein